MNLTRVLEKWKEVELEIPGKVRYAVSNYGGLRSFIFEIEKGRDLKGGITEGFLFLRYKRQTDNVIRNYNISIHKAVAKLFILKDAENQEYVLHLDYDKLNNHISNLKWATYDEMRAHGNKSPAVIESFKKLQAFNIKRDGAKLTSTQVIRIKKILANPNRKTRMKLIAKQFNISDMQLYRIKTGENWGHIKI